MELKDYLLICEKFIKDYLVDNHGEGYVIGISGGIDSAVVAAMSKKAVGKDRLLCVMLPIESSASTMDDAIEFIQKFDLNYIVLDLNETYASIIKEYERLGFTLDASTKGNIKARLRMTALYGLAQNRHSFVLGTDNADERYTGYYTKYGDGGVDLLPIAKLNKSEVREAAKLYGVNESIIIKKPSADLFVGQTDESEMGITYNELDAYLANKPVSNFAKERIEHLHKISEHKRNPIPEPIDFKR